MNPWVAVAALAAALPPVVFWGRIFWNARARVKEDERKELEREVLPWLPGSPCLQGMQRCCSLQLPASVHYGGARGRN